MTSPRKPLAPRGTKISSVARPTFVWLAFWAFLGLVMSGPITAQEPGEPSQPGAAPLAETQTEEAKAEVAEKKISKRKAKRLSRREMKKLEEALPPQFQEFLTEVFFLISLEERRAFLDLEQDYQRDAFIERFWKIRDNYADTGRNEFKIRWYERLKHAKVEFGDLREDRTRMFLTNGEPDARIPFQCTGTVWPLEIWYYQGSERVGYEFFLIFYRRNGGQRYYLFHPADGADELMDFGASGVSGQDFFQDIFTCRDGDVVAGILQRVLNPSYTMEYEMLLAKTERVEDTPDGEWLATFSSYSTDLPPEAKKFEADVTIEYPERYQSRTVLKATVNVDREAVGAAQLGNHDGYNFFLTGEILRGEKLFEQFRYRYDLPGSNLQSDKIPLEIERRIRPGEYTLVIKLEDTNGKGFFRYSEDITVPRIEAQRTRLPEDPESRRILEEANLAIGTDIPTLQLVEPHGTMQVGMVRFNTLVTGSNIEEVRFALNGKVVLQKRRPPYSVELDLGSVPRTHDLRVSAHDEEGNELTSDELTINAGQHQFQVRLLEPKQGVQYGAEADVEAAIMTPEGRPIERVEFYSNETLVATLFQEPWTQRISLEQPGELSYVRAVAYLPDGNSTDQMVYVNAPDYLENVDVEFVELFTAVLDRQSRPIQGLTQERFQIIEDKLPQTISRFEVVDNLPIHAQVMIDVSASMEGNIGDVQQAALSFFQQTIQPKDRASLITFNDHPNLAVKFTKDVDELAGGLAGLKAERGTALYDAIIFGLYYMNGLKGQRTMLLLSDGKDEVSKFTFAQTLEYARRAGVSIYAIGLNIDGKNSGEAKRRLRELSDETGGRTFMIKSTAELPAIYSAIQQELRSRYLIAYQSTNNDPKSGFRSVTVKTDAGEAKTLRGYYP